MRKKFLKNNVIVLTDIISQVGKMMLAEFLRAEANLVIATPHSPQVILESLQKSNISKHQCHVVETDLLQEKGVEKLIQEAVLTYGKVDFWINNAGMSRYGAYDQLDSESVEQLLDVNISLELNGMRTAAAFFKEQKKGHVISLSPVFGRRAHAALSKLKPYSVKHDLDALILTFSALKAELQESNIPYSEVLPAGSVHLLLDESFQGNDLPFFFEPLTVVQSVLKLMAHSDPKIYISEHAVSGTFKIFPSHFIEELKSLFSKNSLLRKTLKSA